MGGAEKWMVETAKKVNKTEQTLLIDVSPNIANLYGKLILHREFKSHFKDNDIKNLPQRISLELSSFIPFTKQWKISHKAFRDARLIYSKFEILEICISLYFGDLRAIRKTVAGIILTPYYFSPQTIFQKIHNILYSSFLYVFFLRQSKRVHLLNKRDEHFLLKKFNLKNILYLPLGLNLPLTTKKLIYIRNGKKLHIIYVGELSERKGVDTIINIIENSPADFIFTIIGDGPLKEDIITLTKINQNCKYLGYVDNNTLYDAYNKNDVILFPSRAESFGLAMIEASSFGLKIVNAQEVSLGLPNYIEHTVSTRDVKKYIKVLKRLLKEKSTQKNQIKQIQKYTFDNFSNSILDPIFMREIVG